MSGRTTLRLTDEELAVIREGLDLVVWNHRDYKRLPEDHRFHQSGIKPTAIARDLLDRTGGPYVESDPA